MNNLPAYVGKLFGLLGGNCAVGMSNEEWSAALTFADRTQLTLHLEGVLSERRPDWVAAELAARFAKNEERNRRLRTMYEEIAHEFQKVGVEFVLLKGFTHAALFDIPLRRRVQYDLDFLCLPEDSQRALQALRRLGYVQHTTCSLSDQHLPPLVRPATYRWRNDYFDPDLPVAIELHTKVWGSNHDRFDLDDGRGFWARRTKIAVDGLTIPAFDERDRFVFAAVHALRHIVRSDAKPAHVFEIGRGLRPRAGCSGNLLQLAAFYFANRWFGAPLPHDFCLPAATQAWFDAYTWAPIANLFEPNKDAVWLHMALLPSAWDRVRVLQQRAARVRHHWRTIAPAMWSGMRWWRRAASMRASHTSA